MGASVDELLDVYDKQIRCMVEFASPVWTSGITVDEINQIERVQKAVFAIILNQRYTSYARALTSLSRTTLGSRRQAVNMNFANKALKSDKFKHWFCEVNPSEQISKNRSVNTNLLVPVEARTKTGSINDDI